MDHNNVNALFARGAVYNMLGKYQMAIDDYSLALEMDSKKKTVYRNLGKFLGLNNNDYSESEKNIWRDEQVSYISSSKNLDNIVLDGDINNYVYNHSKEMALKNASGFNLPLARITNPNPSENKINSNLNFTNENLFISNNESSRINEKKTNSALEYLRSMQINTEKNNNNNERLIPNVIKSNLLSSNHDERSQSATSLENTNSDITSNKSLSNKNYYLYLLSV